MIVFFIDLKDPSFSAVCLSNCHRNSEQILPSSIQRYLINSIKKYSSGNQHSVLYYSGALDNTALQLSNRYLIQKKVYIVDAVFWKVY